jgi:hypothetical protein
MINDPRKYVSWWLSIKKINIDERGGLCSTDKRSYFDLFDTMVLDYYEQIDDFNKSSDKKVRGAPETNLRKALDETISIKMMERRAEISESLKFTGTENLIPLEQFVLAATGKIEKKVVGVLAHFIWQIKRRLADKEIVYHIMPILVGAQGGGKSLALHKLFKPLINLTLELTLTEVTDARFYFALNQNFVAVLDEMAGAKKTEVENLKKQISATYNDVRKLNTNIVTKIKQNASFIGSSNRAVNEIIFDPTGARRFYEVKTLDLLNWDLINSIDYTELFKGINEHLERGYIEAVLAEVKEDQKELVGIDELDSFIEGHQITPGTKEIAAHVIYDAYKTWAEINGIKNPRTSMWVGRRLTNRGLLSGIKKIRGKSTRVYYVNEESEIHKKAFDPLGAEMAGAWK